VKRSQLLIALAALTAAVLACNTPSLGSSSLYKEDFSSKTNTDWCVDSDTTSSSGFDSGEYFFKVQRANWFVWCNPDQKFDAVHIEVNTKNAGSTDDTVFGILCHYQDNGDFYYLGITSGGLYTIRLYINKDETTLAEDSSDAIKAAAASYKLGADCGNGGLVLYVDGQQVASASDTTYTNGDSGLFAWSGDQVPAEIRYDDFVVTKLESATATP
jgi:hypothetical protein